MRKTSIYHISATDHNFSHRSDESLKTLIVSLLCFLFMLGAPLYSSAGLCENPVEESIKISGTVSSADGLLPGVSVSLKGSNTGVITDINGRFTFPEKLEKGDILIFSFLGYKTIEYKINEDTPAELSIIMEEEAIIMTGALSGNQKPSGIRKLLASVKALF